MLYTRVSARVKRNVDGDPTSHDRHDFLDISKGNFLCHFAGQGKLIGNAGSSRYVGKDPTLRHPIVELSKYHIVSVKT